MNVRRLLFPLLYAVYASSSWTASDVYLRIESGGHTADVRKLAYSKDGQTLYSAGSDKVVRVWNTTTGQQERVFHLQIGPGSAGDLDALAVDPQGRWIAVGGTDSVRPAGSRIRETHTSSQTAHTIKILDAHSGEVVTVLGGGSGASANLAPITCLAFSPDGTQLASGDLLSGAIRIWHSGDWKMRSVKKHDNYVTSLAFSADGSMIASGGVDGRLILWNASSGQNQWSQQFGAPIYSLSVSPDGRAVAAGSADKTYKAFDISLGRLIVGGQLPTGVTAVAFSGDSKSLFVSGGDTDAAEAKVWQYSLDGALLRTWHDHRATIFCLATNPVREGYASGGVAGECYMRDLSSSKLISLNGVGTSKRDIGWSADGNQLSWSSSGGGRAAFDFRRSLLVAASGATSSEGKFGTAAQDLEIGAMKYALTGDGRSIVRFEGGSEKGRYRLAGDVPEERILIFAARADGRVVAATQYGIYDFASDFKRRATLVGYEGLVDSMAVSPDGSWVAAATTDQAVRIWALGAKPAPIDFVSDAVQPSISVFTTRGGEWVAWTPAGYYSASAAGDAYVGWQKNRGVGRAADFYQAFQFRQRFYRPDITSRVFQFEGDQEKAVAAASKATGLSADVKPILDADPPGLAIEGISPGEKQPDGSWITSASSVTLKVKLTNAGSTNLKLRLRVDGRSKDLIMTPAQSSDGALQAQLQPGLNVISVVGESPDGIWSTNTDAITVRQGKPDPEGKLKLHVLAIGISAQKDQKIAPLQFADSDAEAIVAAMKSQEGKAFESVSAQLLTNERATAEGIRQALAQLKAEVSSGDEVLVLISGHGDLVGGSGEPYRAVFAPYDASTSDLKSSCIRWSELMASLDALPCRNVVLMADTCRSGGIDIEQFAGYDPASVFARETSDPLRGVVSITSSDTGQLSWEFQDLKHGIFTYAVLQALKKGGPISLRKLFTDVSLFVPQYVASRLQKLQQPRILPPFSVIAAGQSQVDRLYDSIIFSRG